MPSYKTYSLTWVSLTSAWGISSQLLLTLDEGYLLTAAPPDLECGVAPLSPPVPCSSRSLELCFLLNIFLVYLLQIRQLLPWVWPVSIPKQK